MEQTEQLKAAYALRRAMLGDAYVDAQAGDTSPVTTDFQDFITSMAWGAWARGGPFSTRDRSLLVLAMTAALGRMEEFKLHASSNERTGVSEAELYQVFNMGIGLVLIVNATQADRILRSIRAAKQAAWLIGEVARGRGRTRMVS